jgi:hypothetical protein
MMRRDMTTDWPSREQWAERRSSVSWATDPPATTRELPLYASPEEIEAAIVSLKKLWAGLGREMKAAEDPWNYRDRRREINDVIGQLRNCEVPWRVLDSIRTPSLDVIVTRYRAAVQATHERFVAKCAARPIDDAAWQEELERRARIDQWLSTSVIK